MNASGPKSYGTAAFSRDTSPEAGRKQVALWRAMTPLEKARLVSSTSRAAQLLCLAGIRRRYPDASEEERMLRLAKIKLGPELFALAYPEAASRLQT